jgi:hypothetical protein
MQNSATKGRDLPMDCARPCCGSLFHLSRARTLLLARQSRYRPATKINDKLRRRPRPSLSKRPITAISPTRNDEVIALSDGTAPA